jgi:hypothetical protein
MQSLSLGNSLCDFIHFSNFDLEALLPTQKAVQLDAIPYLQFTNGTVHIAGLLFKATNMEAVATGGDQHGSKGTANGAFGLLIAVPMPLDIEFEEN